MGINSICINEGVAWDTTDCEEFVARDYNILIHKFPLEVRKMHNVVKEIKNMNFDDPKILILCDLLLDNLCYFNINFLNIFIKMIDNGVFSFDKNSDSRNLLKNNMKHFILNKDKLVASPLTYQYDNISSVYNDNNGSISAVFADMSKSHYSEKIVPIPSIFETINGELANWDMDDYMNALYTSDQGVLKKIEKPMTRTISTSELKYDLYGFRESGNIYDVSRCQVDTYGSLIANGLKIRKNVLYDISVESETKSISELTNDIRMIVFSIINYVYISCFYAASRLYELNNDIVYNNTRNKMILDFISMVNKS